MTATFLKADTDNRRVYGIALEADVLDRQGDVVNDRELEEAACRAVLNAVPAGVNHDRIGVGRLVASFPMTREIQQALGINLGRSVWLVGFQITDESTWQAVKRGDLKAFSIGGTGKRSRSNG